MDREHIRAKFGDDYFASDRTYTMGIDRRFTAHIAERFRRLVVLETCTGGGFSTIALAREARHVITVEIDSTHQDQARKNLETAGLLGRVTLVLGDVTDDRVLQEIPPFDAAFLDPDWAVTGPEHVYRFRNSNTQPPADLLLEKILDLTPNVALVLPPLIDLRELEGLREHERQRLYFADSHELYCLYFGRLVRSLGSTELRI